METKTITKNGRDYVINKIGVFKMQKVLFHCINAFKAKDLTVIPDETLAFLCSNIAVVTPAGTPLYFNDEQIIEMNIPNTGTLVELEMALLEYNLGFLSDGSLFTEVNKLLSRLFPKKDSDDAAGSAPTATSKA